MTTKDMHVYLITEKGEREFWTKIGVATRDHEGLSFRITEPMPAGGIIQVRNVFPVTEALR